MNITSFCEDVEQSKLISGVGMIMDNNTVVGLILKNNFNGVEVKVPVDAIDSVAVSEPIFDIVLGNREPSTLYHMSRIVGYFSKIENWNSSKIGELSDRHKGNYSVSEAV